MIRFYYAPYYSNQLHQSTLIKRKIAVL